jgi:alpha-N-arabinofuranosidase
VKDGVVTLTLTNPHLTQGRETEIVLRGGTVRAVSAMTLTHADVHAHNTFEAPRTVTPSMATIPPSAGTLVHRLPPASVTRLQFTLGA